MGGKGSKHDKPSPGSLLLLLEARSLQAGSELTGIIHLRLLQDVRAHSLGLLFQGRERCRWEETRTEKEADGTEKTVTDVYMGDYLMVMQKLPIFAFTEGILRVGDYSFPFTFLLPTNVPSSFELVLGSIEASIQYSLTAVIDGLSDDITPSTATFNISKVMNESIHSVVASRTAPLSTWCGCVKKGEVHFKVYFHKDAYVPGETAECIVEVNNTNSQLNVTGVRGCLFRTVRLYDGKGSSKLVNQLISQTTTRQLVPSGQTLLGEQSIRMSLVLSDTDNQLTNTTSANGKLVQCTFHVTVFVNVQSIGRSPSIAQTVVIYPYQLPVVPAPVVPENWAPQEMPGVYVEGDQPSAPHLP